MTMTVGWLEVVTPEKVANSDDPVKTFATYAQQVLGVPWPTIKDLTITRKKAEQLFETTPGADWYTLCRVVAWAKSKKKRPARTWMIIEMVREAWAKGALPELDPANRQDRRLEEAIAEALKVETDDWWRRRLLLCEGLDARRLAYQEWKESHPQFI